LDEHQKRPKKVLQNKRSRERAACRKARKAQKAYKVAKKEREQREAAKATTAVGKKRR
jgi:hypothetical protein